MASHTIDSWTFTSLVGGFLDLSIAYLLLCCSTLTFLASKFLSFFGLYLPCPCNGLFADPKCLRTLLVDVPTSKIASVHLSVKNKFPFDSILIKDPYRRHMNAKLLKNGGGGGGGGDPFEGFVEIEGEASSSSLSDVKVTKGFSAIKSSSTRQGLHEGKEKAISNQRPPRTGALRRRRRSMVDNSRTIMERDVSQSPLRNGQEETLREEENLVPQFDKEAQAGYELSDGTQHSFQLNDFQGESKNTEKDESSSSEGQNAQQGFDDKSEAAAVRVLEQALEEEHAALAALYQELEKERSAAAGAADEAMAMILRLHEEKASVEMEARQYQRMIEEKSAYDAEEMNILKEIIVRREREKHFLEKEVEVYRLMMLTGTEKFEGDMHVLERMYVQRPISSSNSSEDPMLMLQQISESINKKEIVKDMNYDVETRGRVLVFGEESPLRGWDEAGDISKQGHAWGSVGNIPHGPGCTDGHKQVFQEKEIVSMKGHPSASQDQESELDSGFCELDPSQEDISLHKMTNSTDEEQGKNDNGNLSQGMGRETDTSFPCDVAYLEKHVEDGDQDRGYQHSSISEAEPSVLDVHVIDDKSESSNQEIQKGSGSLTDTTWDRFRNLVVQSEASSSRMIYGSRHPPSTTRGNESDIRRSRSDMSSGLDKSLGETLLFDLRRNSMSTVERLKLENEVEWLRERLKIVQEGREKLSFSVEHREREKFHLQLLEDIARQLQEIRQLTEPGKSVRQASLPPLSSKVSSKKRRYRSGSWGVHGSS